MPSRSPARWPASPGKNTILLERPSCGTRTGSVPKIGQELLGEVNPGATFYSYTEGPRPIELEYRDRDLLVNRDRIMAAGGPKAWAEFLETEIAKRKEERAPPRRRPRALTALKEGKALRRALLPLSRRFALPPGAAPRAPRMRRRCRISGRSTSPPATDHEAHAQGLSRISPPRIPAIPCSPWRAACEAWHRLRAGHRRRRRFALMRPTHRSARAGHRRRAPRSRSAGSRGWIARRWPRRFRLTIARRSPTRSRSMRLPAAAARRRPPATDRFGQPWQYALTGFAKVAGFTDQKYSLQSAALGDTSDSRPRSRSPTPRASGHAGAGRSRSREMCPR